MPRAGGCSRWPEKALGFLESELEVFVTCPVWVLGIDLWKNRKCF